MLGCAIMWRPLTSRMKIRLDVECYFLVAAYYRDGTRVAGGEEKRGVDNIVRLDGFLCCPLGARCRPAECRNSPPACYRGSRSLPHRSRLSSSACINLRTDPAMTHFAKADEIAADFFRGFDRQRVTGRIIFQSC